MLLGSSGGSSSDSTDCSSGGEDSDKPSIRTPLLPPIAKGGEELKGREHTLQDLADNLVTRSCKSRFDEACTLCGYSIPVALSSAARNFHDMTDQFILGHLGTEYLAACGVAGIWTFLFDVMVLESVIQLSTLCSQAFGAGNYTLVGEWFQLGLCCFTLMCVPVIVTRWFTADFLEYMGFDANLAYLAGEYTTYSQLSILCDVVFFSCRSYLSAQGIVKPSMIIDNVAVVVNLGVAYLMTFPMGLGLIGAAIATTITRFLRTVMYILYCFAWKGYHKRTWDGWTAKTLTNPKRWKILLGLALPAAWGALTEEIQYELLCFMAAKMGSVVIAAHNLSLSMMDLFFVFSTGIGQGVGVRVAAAISSFRIADAKRTVEVGLELTLVSGVVLGAAYVALLPLLAPAASDDPEVQSLLKSLSPYVAVGIAAMMCLTPAFQVLLNQGRSKISSNIIAVCCWVVGFPISYIYGLKLNGGVYGLWLGLIAGYGTSVVVMVLIICKTDWIKVCREARLRSEVTRGVAAAAQ